MGPLESLGPRESGTAIATGIRPRRVEIQGCQEGYSAALVLKEGTIALRQGSSILTPHARQEQARAAEEGC